MGHVLEWGSSNAKAAFSRMTEYLWTPRTRDRLSSKPKPTVHIRKWLADTGCGFDLVKYKDIRGLEEYAVESRRNVVLQTANGLARVSHEVHIFIPELQEEICALVLDSTPPVISVGRRVLTQG